MIMLKVNIVCIGKIKESFYRDAISEYAKRLTRFCKFNIVELQESLLVGKNAQDIEKVKVQEGKNIISKLSGYIIVLDLGGKQLSSEDLATTIESVSNSYSEITFVIGGSYGLSSEVLEKADKKIAFGKITFPHQLMRVVLVEQIYRAFMINSNSDYHK